jgi:hypothetical protein
MEEGPALSMEPLSRRRVCASVLARSYNAKMDKIDMLFIMLLLFFVNRMCEVPAKLSSSEFSRKFELVDVPGDGKCFYTAFAIGFLGPLARQSQIKKKADEIRVAAGNSLCSASNFEDIKQFMTREEGSSFCSGLKLNSNQVTLADHIIIQKIADQTKTKIIIYRKPGHTTHMSLDVIKPQHLNSHKCVYVFLNQNSVDDRYSHYSALQLKLKYTVSLAELCSLFSKRSLQGDVFVQISAEDLRRLNSSPAI